MAAAWSDDLSQDSFDDNLLLEAALAAEQQFQCGSRPLGQAGSWGDGGVYWLEVAHNRQASYPVQAEPSCCGALQWGTQCTQQQPAGSPLLRTSELTGVPASGAQQQKLVSADSNASHMTTIALPARLITLRQLFHRPQLAGSSVATAAQAASNQPPQQQLPGLQAQAPLGMPRQPWQERPCCQGGRPLNQTDQPCPPAAAPVPHAKAGPRWAPSAEPFEGRGFSPAYGGALEALQSPLVVECMGPVQASTRRQLDHLQQQQQQQQRDSEQPDAAGTIGLTTTAAVAVVAAQASAAPGSPSCPASGSTESHPAEQAAEAGTSGEAACEPEAERKRGKLRQLFDYLVVYDLEATCDKEKKLQPQEIIELSAVIVDTHTLRLGATFQQYVRPTCHPQLTSFCTELTGITQDMVEAGISLEATLERHTAWLREQGILGQGKSFVPASWTSWDMMVQMEGECKWRQVPKPKYLSRWVDLKEVFKKHYNARGNLKASVEHVGLKWEGRAHSAIDDAINTARLAIKLMQRGLVLGITGSFSGVDASGKLKQTTLFGDRKPKKQRIYDDAGKWSGKCSCGVKAKKRTVKRPGPTNGKDFWSCGRYTATGGAQCDFFKWVEAATY